MAAFTLTFGHTGREDKGHVMVWVWFGRPWKKRARARRLCLLHRWVGGGGWWAFDPSPFQPCVCACGCARLSKLHRDELFHFFRLLSSIEMDFAVDYLRAGRSTYLPVTIEFILALCIMYVRGQKRRRVFILLALQRGQINNNIPRRNKFVGPMDQMLRICYLAVLFYASINLNC